MSRIIVSMWKLRWRERLAAMRFAVAAAISEECMARISRVDVERVDPAVSEVFTQQVEAYGVTLELISQ